MIRLLPSGKFQADHFAAGQRRRRNFPSQASAQDWLDLQNIRQHSRLSSLSPRDELDAREALALLRSQAAAQPLRLVEAARIALATHKPADARTMTAAGLAYVADKAAARLRPRSLRKLRHEVVGQLCDLLPERTVSSITTADLRPLLLPTWSASTVNTHRASWSAFFRWCGRREDNPVAGLTRARENAAAPGIFTPQQTARWLQYVADRRPELLPFFAIGFFAGLRTSEIEGLTWADIGTAAIRVRPEVAKQRRQRMVPILPPLRRILAAYRQGGDRLSPPAASLVPLRERARLIWTEKNMALAGLDFWPRNVMRHSYCTYRLAETQNIGQVTLEAGNSADVLLTHYRALATPQDAKKYFKISVKIVTAPR